MPVTPCDLEASLRSAADHVRAGRLEEAEHICRDLLAHEPGPPGAWHLLGAIARRHGNHAAAAELFEEAMRIAGERADYLGELGISLGHLGRLEQALGCFQRSLALEPGNAATHNNIGNTLCELGRADEAEVSLRRALALKPDYADALGNLGIALRAQGRLMEAEDALRAALRLNPGDAGAHNNLGATCFGLGRLEEAERSYREALALEPGMFVAHRNLLSLMNYAPEHAPGAVFAAHREFARRFLASASERDHANAAIPGRKLRVGYVSGDFRRHPVAIFIEPVLERHDRHVFEVFCYHSCAQADDVTARLRGLADQWCEAAPLDDAAFVERVLADRIDVLVDLSGHTTFNRLAALAQRPAPVQASWLGYLNTTGVDAIGYRITDPWASPGAAFDAIHSEKLLRLPVCQWCYQPSADCPDPGPVPGAARGATTFAAFANPAKITAPVMALWARLLERVPRSRLLVVTNGLAQVPAGYAARYAAHGIAPERLEVRGSMRYRDYLAVHREVDVILDTFPYAGGTTTCHALWMGVPVVTLVGEAAASRGGATLLHAAGLDELVARTPAEYLEIAAALALDPARLATLRAGMRERLRASPLLDAARFTRDLEEGYRSMWRAWCASRPRPGILRRLAARMRT